MMHFMLKILLGDVAERQDIVLVRHDQEFDVEKCVSVGGFETVHVFEHALHGLLVVFEEGNLLGAGFLVKWSAEVDT
jgi:hypothetical protein